MLADKLEILGTLIGLLYLWLEYRASMWMWVTGIIMPAIYIFVYYDAGLYADFAINIYYVLAAVYGVIAWQYGGGKEKTELPVSRMPLRLLPRLLLVFAILFVAIGWVLMRYTDSTVPWADSFTTALSIVGMYMLARKYIEQWWTWVAVDAVCVVLYVIKNLEYTAALYALYTVIAVAGYYKWRRQLEK